MLPTCRVLRHVGNVPPQGMPARLDCKPVPLCYHGKSMITRSSAACFLLCLALPLAADAQHWSFRPRSVPAVPHVKAAQRVRTSVDAFVLQKLEAEGLTLSS